MKRLKKGCLGTYDSLIGEIPVKVVHINGVSGIAGRQSVVMEVTTDSGPYKEGTTLLRPALWVRPRDEKSNDYFVECDA